MPASSLKAGMTSESNRPAGLAWDRPSMVADSSSAKKNPTTKIGCQGMGKSARQSRRNCEDRDFCCILFETRYHKHKRFIYLSPSRPIMISPDLLEILRCPLDPQQR